MVQDNATFGTVSTQISMEVDGFHIADITKRAMPMEAGVLYSAFLVMQVRHAATAPLNTCRLAHALFLNLIGQFDPSLSARLHNEPGYRPFTVSPIQGLPITGKHLVLHNAQTCHLRITLLDG